MIKIHIRKNTEPIICSRAGLYLNYRRTMPMIQSVYPALPFRTWVPYEICTRVIAEWIK